MSGPWMRGVASGAAIAWVVMGAGPAAASCAAEPGLERAVADAEILLVGTVTETTNYGRWAVVSVEEVWKGDGIPHVVQIRGGTADAPGPMRSVSSVDRSFTTDRRYLFFLYGREGAVMQDNSCSSTRVFSEDLARLRPASVSTPEPGAVGPDDFDPGTGPGIVDILGAVISGLVAAFGVRKLIASK